MGRFVSGLGVAYCAAGMLGVAFDEALLGRDAVWTSWFSVSFVLMAIGGWMIWHEDRIWDPSFQPGRAVPARWPAFRPVVIQGGKPDAVPPARAASTRVESTAGEQPAA